MAESCQRPQEGVFHFPLWLGANTALQTQITPFSASASLRLYFSLCLLTLDQNWTAGTHRFLSQHCFCWAEVEHSIMVSGLKTDLVRSWKRCGQIAVPKAVINTQTADFRGCGLLGWRHTNKTGGNRVTWIRQALPSLAPKLYFVVCGRAVGRWATYSQPLWHRSGASLGIGITGLSLFGTEKQWFVLFFF